MNPLIASLLSGAAWGVLGAYFTFRLAGPWSPYATISGPLIGIFIFYISRWVYRRSWLLIIPWSIISTYIAVILFGFALGIAHALQPLSGVAWKVIVESAIACPAGLTIIPFFWILFPLALFNHLFIKWLDTRAEQDAAANP